MSILDNLLPVVIRCLTDQSDDVRSVAAVALLPVADALVDLSPQQVSLFDLFGCVDNATAIPDAPCDPAHATNCC